MYKVLIADDEQLERDALKAIINKNIDSIIEIKEAFNGREAVAMARSFSPDIIFLDIKMPGLNGIEAAKMIRETDSEVLIVFLTAFNQFEYAREAIQIKVEDFIIKPSPENQILETIKKLIKKTDILKEERNSRKNNEIKLSRVTGYLENEFIYNLSVRGIPEDKFYDYLSILDIKFSAGRGGIIKILYDTYPIEVETEYQKKVLRKRCIYIFRSVFGSAGMTAYFNTDLSSIYFLLTEKTAEDKSVISNDRRIYELTGTAVEEIQKTLNLQVVSGIGSLFNTPGTALNSFIEARNSTDTGSVYKDEFPVSLEIEMEQAILGNDRENTRKLFNSISEWFETSMLGFDGKKKFIIELAAVLKHAYIYQSPDGLCPVKDNEVYEASDSSTLLSSLNIFLNNLLVQITKDQGSGNAPVIDKAVKYIEENYSRDITLEEVASYCSLSSFYFSKLFRKKKKINFIDYLTELRIKKAGKLLTGTNLSIKEISNTVGYSDPNYFTRVFKRSKSISPSLYRTRKS